MNSGKIEDQFLTALLEKCGAAEQRILVALSGGPDSVALLHLLVATQKLWQGQLFAAHINHKLRAAAEDDALFCSKLCEHLQIPFFTEKVDVRDFSANEKLSIETAARELRYETLDRILREQKCNLLALGHHADDQAETTLGNLLRGTGLRGLAGMPYKFGNRIRPLLGLSQNDLLDFLKEQQISYRKDESNLDTQFKRNKIRHKLLPYLQQEYNPQISDALNKLSQISNHAEDYLVSEAGKALQAMTIEETEFKIVLDIERFWSYFDILQKYALRLAIEKLTSNQIRPNYSDLERIETSLKTNKIGTQIPLHGKWEALIDREVIVFRATTAFNFDMHVEMDGFAEHKDGWKITATRIDSAGIDPRNQATRFSQFTDNTKIKGRIRVRSFRKGDFFYPLGLKGKKSISDYFTDRKVALYKRKEIPIVYCDTGIIWIVGHHLDERFKVTSHTNSIIKFEFKDKNL